MRHICPRRSGSGLVGKRKKGFGGARWFVKEEEEEEEEEEAPLGILQGRWREEEEEGGSVHGGGGLLWRKEKTAWREGGREGEIGWIRRGYGHSSCSCRM